MLLHSFSFGSEGASRRLLADRGYQVRDNLSQFIRYRFDEVFKPGDHLGEVDLAEKFEVSRSPVREALLAPGSILLANGFKAEGEVRLQDDVIDGTVDCIDGSRPIATSLQSSHREPSCLARPHAAGLRRRETASLLEWILYSPKPAEARPSGSDAPSMVGSVGALLEGGCSEPTTCP
jgi:Bacterial regulatory proteins, gntR family